MNLSLSLPLSHFPPRHASQLCVQLFIARSYYCTYGDRFLETHAVNTVDEILQDLRADYRYIWREKWWPFSGWGSVKPRRLLPLIFTDVIKMRLLKILHYSISHLCSCSWICGKCFIPMCISPLYLTLQSFISLHIFLFKLTHTLFTIPTQNASFTYAPFLPLV